MKYIKFLILLLFLVSNYVLAEKKFSAERMITDYNGAVNNGKVVLCYGNYGIITYSEDFCKSWKQLNIGDKFNISKIIEKNGIFYGITDYSVIKSEDNGLNWNNIILSDKAEITSIFLRDNTIFISSFDKIFELDLSLKIVNDDVLEQNTYNNFKSLVADNENIYINSDNTQIILYNFDSKITSLLNIKPSDYHQNFDKFLKLDIFNNEVYITLEQQNFYSEPSFDSYYNGIIKSNDKGKNWKSITNKMIGTTCFKFIDDSLYTIRPKHNEVKWENYKYNYDNFFSIEFSKYAENGDNFTINNNKIEKDIFYNYLLSEKYFFTDIVKINNNTLLSVGINKSMFISYDMGKNWELISYFPSYKVIDNSNKPFFVNENVIYQPYISTNSLYATENFFSQKGFLISKDGGILWKPAAYNFLDTHRISASYTSYIFDDKGQGVLIRNSYGENNARIYFTNDYAITFSEYKELNPVCEMQAISDDNILYMNGKYWMHFLYTDNKTKSYLTKYLGFNLQNKSIDSLVFDDTTKFYSNWIKTNNENIYTLNIQKKDYTDSIPYKYKKMDFYLTNSTNGGKNWADINEKIPFNIYLKENGYSAGYQNGFFKNNNLYFPYFDSTLYRYNLIQNKWDSVQFNRDYFAHINFSYSGNKFFINNSLFLTSLTFNTNSTIYYCPDIDNDLYNWKLIEMNNLLNNEISESNPIIIESAYSDNKNILLNVQEFINMNLSKRNIIKMYIKDSIMNVNELEKISSEKIYLYNYKPFPQPAKHSIKCIISWDIKYNIDEAEYSIYDYLGNRYSNIKITLDKTLSDLGTLNWDCSNFCPGLYFISVYFHSEILKIPVIII